MFVTHAEGCYLHTASGQRILDFNSGAMCANLGHTVPQPIIDAVVNQVKTKQNNNFISRCFFFFLNHHHQNNNNVFTQKSPQKKPRR